ncbi:uncharacterized protein LOC119585407 [Penaeus monodon]|uniref:uncharacterized protein LOC119585407 n=1 Tax=Penaeus monodon TaxID=6687 RepID=UPI0018A6EDDF|nr:uncharacterized protein LOC119585407 [Penaeus monodon]
MTTMDLMSSDAPLKMLSMTTGGLSKETTTLLEERTPTTPEGLWRAFLQGSHHAPAPTTPRMDIIDRPGSPESPGGRGRISPGGGINTRASPSPPPSMTAVCEAHAVDCLHYAVPTLPLSCYLLLLLFPLLHTCRYCLSDARFVSPYDTIITRNLLDGNTASPG